MRKWVGLLLASGLVGCATTTFYRGPTPGAPGTASLRLEPLDQGTYFASATTTLLHVYDTGAVCPKAALDRAGPAYRGLVDASLLRNTFTIPSDRWMFFSFEIGAVLRGRDRPWRCAVPFGFRPEEGAAYTLQITIAGDEICLVDLYDDANRRLPPTDPETCAPWWGEDPATAP